MVTYQIFMGKFVKNFKELEDKVYYIKELGVDNVWITPFLDSPSYHGYDTLDYYKIKEEYGTLEDFKSMCNTYRSHGITIMMDLVLCHTSDEHEWFKKSVKGEYPYKDYYIWSSIPKSVSMYADCHDQSTSEKWHLCKENNLYYYGSFNAKMPSLNLDNTDLRREIESIVFFWNRLGVKNFRLDAVIHSHFKKEDSISFWNWFRQTCKTIDDEIELVGEAWTSSTEMSTWANALGSCFDFQQSGTVVDNIKKNDLRNLSFKMKEIADISRWANHTNSMFLSNHDQDRVMYTLGNDSDKARVAASTLLASKGNPYIYYGEEIGLSSSKENGDEYVRQDMDFNEVSKQRVDKLSLLNLYKDLIKVRKSSMALQHGNFIPVYTSEHDCMCIQRKFYSENIFVVINNGREATASIPHGKYKFLYGKEGIINYNGESFNKGIYVLKLL